MKLSAIVLAMVLAAMVAVWHAQNLSPLSGAWLKAGEGAAYYDVGLDWLNQRSGKGAKTIRNPDYEEAPTATVMQSIRADLYRSTQVRFSAEVKASGVQRWGGLWMQVETYDGKILALDNMQVRPLKGDSDWQRHDVILNIGPDAGIIRFGMHLTGVGQLWMDALEFEKVIDQRITTEQKHTQQFIREALEPVL